MNAKQPNTREMYFYTRLARALGDQAGELLGLDSGGKSSL